MALKSYFLLPPLLKHEWHTRYFDKEKNRKKRKHIEKVAMLKTKRKRNKCQRLCVKYEKTDTLFDTHYAVVFWF